MSKQMEATHRAGTKLTIPSSFGVMPENLNITEVTTNKYVSKLKYTANFMFSNLKSNFKKNIIFYNSFFREFLRFSLKSRFSVVFSFDKSKLLKYNTKTKFLINKLISLKNKSYLKISKKTRKKFLNFEKRSNKYIDRLNIDFSYLFEKGNYSNINGFKNKKKIAELFYATTESSSTI